MAQLIDCEGPCQEEGKPFARTCPTCESQLCPDCVGFFPEACPVCGEPWPAPGPRQRASRKGSRCKLYPATEVLILVKRGRRYQLLNQQGKASYDLNRGELRSLLACWDGRQGPFVQWSKSLAGGRAGRRPARSSRARHADGGERHAADPG